MLIIHMQFIVLNIYRQNSLGSRSKKYSKMWSNFFIRIKTGKYVWWIVGYGIVASGYIMVLFLKLVVKYFI